MHFFNPVPASALVGRATSPEALAAAHRLAALVTARSSS
jgi:hypothetical protein